MKRLRSPKVCAALVMIAWLATLIALWGFGVAGRKAIGDDPSCSVSDLQNKGVQMELASTAGDMREVLNGNPFQAECIRRGETGSVAFGDSFFLVAYSLLTLALFLFVRALRLPAGKGLLALGVLLALTMATADWIENRHLLQVIRLAGEAGPPLDRIEAVRSDLNTAAWVKMGAIALASAILGALWPSRSRWIWVLRLLGFATAALFAGAFALDLGDQVLMVPGRGRPLADWDLAGQGMVVFALFAAAALIHAVAVMADPEAYSVPQPAAAQGGPKS